MSDQLLSIRRKLLPCQGRAIRLYVHKERNQSLDIKGVLEGVYAGVFTVYAQSGRIRPPLLLFLPRYPHEECPHPSLALPSTWAMERGCPPAS